MYFDHKRRTDPDFRKALKRESRRQQRIAKEEAETQGKQQKEEIKRTVEEALAEGFPTDLEEKEAFFMQQIGQGEAIAGSGTLSLRTNTPIMITKDSSRFGSNWSGLVLLQGFESLPRAQGFGHHLR